MKVTLPLIFSIALTATMAAASLAAWSSVPSGAELPVHFGFDGTPNRYAPASFALSVVPMATLAATLIFALAPRLDRKVDAFPVRYTALWLVVIAALAIGHFQIVGYALAN
ncbi:DUF1648 domain-containing protein [Neorhizobium sp. DT-125]|uniref:DUF1648 domain-containing protein n=1 Tax=Neorhizobium sp. DT-125 TaxID=3396163 RepID=UPI003F1D87CF